MNEAEERTSKRTALAAKIALRTAPMDSDAYRVIFQLEYNRLELQDAMADLAQQYVRVQGGHGTYRLRLRKDDHLHDMTGLLETTFHVPSWPAVGLVEQFEQAERMALFWGERMQRLQKAMSR